MNFFRKVFLLNGRIVWIISLGIIITSIGIYFLLNHPAPSPEDIRDRVDTVLVQTLFDNAEELRGSQPSASLILCDSAISLFKNRKLTDSERKTLASVHILKASIQCNLGKYPESEKDNAWALEIAKETGDRNIEAQTINITGLLYYNQGVYDSAMLCYQKALKLAIDAGNKKLQAKLYTNAAIINYYQGKCENAISDFKKTLTVGEELQDKELISGSYINLGLIYQEVSDYPNAIEAYQKATEIYKSIQGDDGVLMCYQNMGNIYFNQAMYDRALESFGESLSLAEKIDDRYSIAMAHHNIGEVYAQLGDFETALNEYLLSIKIKEQLNDKRNLATGFSGIGNLHFQHKGYQQALEYYEKALLLNEELKNVKGIAAAYSNLASVYQVEDKFDEAISYHLKALELNHQIGNKNGESDANLSLGTLYLSKSDFYKSLEYFQTALSQKIQLSDKEGIANIYSEMSRLYLLRFKQKGGYGNLRKAIEFGHKSQDIAQNIKALPLLNSTYLALKEAYKESGNTFKALEYAEKYLVTSDSLFNKNKTEALILAEVRWKAEKKQKQIDNLENQRQLNLAVLKQKTAENQRQKFIIVGIIILLVVTTGFSIIIIQLIKRRRDELYQKQLSSITALKMENSKNIATPHFLFNLLSSVFQSENMSESQRKKLKSASFLLRRVLENVDKTAIRLEEELSMVKEFLELQQEKFAMDVRIDVSEGVNTSILIPAMIIQIPVENAIKHGLMPLENKQGRLDIRIGKTDYAHEICIIDNGVGLSSSKRMAGSGTGTGLKILMQTIHLLNSKNKNHITFTMGGNKDENGKEEGVRVEITLPLVYVFNL